MKKIIVFLGDLRDKNAAQLNEEFSLKSAGGLLFAGVASLGAFIGNFKIILVETFGLIGAAIPPSLLILALIWCLNIISVKKTPAVVGLHREENTPVYTYPSYARRIAKFAFIVLLVALPYYLFTVWNGIKFLPAEIMGQVRNMASGAPVQKARVRIVRADGSDVTQGQPLTDQDGFYTATTRVRVDSNARLEVIAPFCKPVKLSLNSNFLIDTVLAHTETKIYNHYIEDNCAPPPPKKAIGNGVIINLFDKSHIDTLINGNQNNYYEQKVKVKK